MAENHEPTLKALAPARPGDPISARRWNEMQCLLRSEHVQHAHTGAWNGDLFDGVKITTGGLADAAVTTPRIADRAVTGAKVDPATTITVHNLTTTGTVEAAALALTEADVVALPCRDLRLGHSTRRGAAAGRALTDLKHDGHDYLGINDGADWTEGVKIGGGLLVTGKAAISGDLHAAAATLAGPLTARTSAAIAGALTVGGGLTVTGALTATDSATLSGTVTASAGLTVNGPITAAAGLAITGAPTTISTGLAVTGAPITTLDLKVVGSFTANNGLTVTGGAFTATSGLTASGAPVAANNGLKVTGAVTLQSTLAVTGNAVLQGALSVTGNATIKGRSVLTGEDIWTPRITYGCVYADGTIVGAGFTATYDPSSRSTTIKFIKRYTDTPAIVSQILNSTSPAENTVHYMLDFLGCTILCGDVNGERVRRDFFFMAVGQPLD